MLPATPKPDPPPLPDPLPPSLFPLMADFLDSALALVVLLSYVIAVLLRAFYLREQLIT